MSDRRQQFSNISEAPHEADYVKLKGLPASHLRPLFQSMHSMELMAISFVELTFDEWKAVDANPGHSFVWFRVVSKIISRFRTAEEVLDRLHQYLLHRFLCMHGYNDETLLPLTDILVKKTVAHVCIKLTQQFCDAP